MNKSVSLIPVLILISFFSCRTNQKPSSEDAFLGEWYTIKGYVEAYSFLKDESSYIFSGSQGMRPVIYGTWKIENNKFIILMDNGTKTEYDYILNNDTLTFNGGEEIYTRTPPLEIIHPEVIILKNIISDFSTLAFNLPEPSEIRWGVYIDSTKSFREFSLAAFSISAGVQLSSPVLSDLINYFRDHGFESDTMFMSEICSGFWDTDHIITLCTGRDPDSDNDSVLLSISSGILVK